MINKRLIIASWEPLCAFVVLGCCWGAFAALVPDLQAAIGAGDGELAGVMLVAAMGAIAAMRFAPWLDSRLGRYGVAALCAAALLAFQLPGLMSSWTGLTIAMFLCAASTASLDVVMNAHLSQIEAREGHPLMSFHHAMFSFGYAIAAFCTGLIREFGGGAVISFSIIGVFGLLLLPSMVLPKPADQADETNDAATSGSNQFLVLIGIVIAIAFMGEQASEGWSALHLERALGVGAVLGAMGPAILGLTMGIGRLGGQAMARVFSEARVIQIAALFAAFGSGLAATAINLPLTYIGFAALGLGISVIAPLGLALVGRISPADQRVKAISNVALIGYTGFFIGPPIMGGLAELASLSVSFVALSLLLASITLVLIPMLAGSSQKG